MALHRKITRNTNFVCTFYLGQLNLMFSTKPLQSLEQKLDTERYEIERFIELFKHSYFAPK